MYPAELDLLPPETIRPLKRSEYARLIELGAFEGERVELLYGRIVAMSPQKGPHTTAVARINRVLVLAMGDRAAVRIQSPLAAPDESEPEPDVAVVDGLDHVVDHPTSAHLVIEVADSSRLKDLRIKAPLYAAMAVPDYWVLDLTRDELIVHREPDRDGYRQVNAHGPDAEIALLRFPDIVLGVRDMLPPR